MIKTFFASGLRKNIAQLLSANVLSQVIALIVYPLITRLYTPEEFGVFNIFMSICSVCFVLSAGRYDGAIIQSKTNKEAAAVFHLCLIITACLSVCLVATIFFFKNQLLQFFSIEKIGWGIYIMPMLVFCYGVGTVLNRWFNRFKQYRSMSRYLIVQSGVNSLFKVLLGWLHYTRLGLVFSLFLGYVMSLLSIIFTNGKRRIFSFLVDFDKRRIATVAKQYTDFPKYALPHAFVNMLSSNLPILVMAPYFGEKQIGLYSLAMAIGFCPINVIVSSINQVFYQQVTEYYNSGEPIKPIFRNFSIKTLGLFLPLFVLIYFVLPPAVDFLFGGDWHETSRYLQVLIPWFFAMLFTGTFAFIPVVFFKQRMAMTIEIIYTICRLLALIYGVFVNDFYLAIVAFSGVSFVFIAGQFIWYYSLILRYENRCSEK